MLRYLATFLALSLGQPSALCKEFVVVVEGEMILIFDDAASASTLDTRFCYNAVTSKKFFKKIVKIKQTGRDPNLKIVKVRDFFVQLDWQYNYSGHYIYDGNPVSNFCDRLDLFVITNVSELQ